MWIWIVGYFIGFVVCYCLLRKSDDFNEDAIFVDVIGAIVWPVLAVVIGLHIMFVGFDKILKKAWKYDDD